MDTIIIAPEYSEADETLWHAASQGRKSIGKTAGEALDNLTRLLGTNRSGAMVVIQPMEADRFFTEEQRMRLKTLMGKWRQARDSGTPFSEEEQRELEALVEAQLEGAAKRAESMLADIKP